MVLLFCVWSHLQTQNSYEEEHHADEMPMHSCEVGLQKGKADPTFKAMVVGIVDNFAITVGTFATLRH